MGGYTPSQYMKAIVGGILAGLTALGTALTDGALDPVEIVGIVIAVVGTFGAVFGVQNAPAEGRFGMHKNERGYANGPYGYVGVVILVILILILLAVTGVIG